MIGRLKNKKRELENLFDLKHLKPTRFLKLLIEEIRIMKSAYSRVEQIELIKRVFDKDINYNTYVQFYNKYIVNSKNIPVDSSSSMHSHETREVKQEGTNDLVVNLTRLNDTTELKKVDKAKFK